MRGNMSCKFSPFCFLPLPVSLSLSVSPMGIHWKDVKKIESKGVEEETNVTVVGIYS